MTPRNKKYLSYFVIGLFFFLGGVEYAVILPTAWLYLETRYDAAEYLLGFLISAFCLSGLFAGPIMGRWSDKIGGTKMIFLIANLFEIVGNIMYFLGISAWFLVAARFVAGIGAGVGAAIIADISRITTSEERTGVISLFMAVRQIGLLIGPACNLFLRETNFNIGSFKVDKYSSPGVFMALLWIILEILVVFIYWDLPSLKNASMHQSMDYSYRQDSESQLLPPNPSPSIIPSEDTPLFHPDTPPPPLTDSEDFLNPAHRTRTGSATPPVAVNQSQVLTRQYPNLEVVLTSSTEMIESAERFMGAGSPDSGPITFSATPEDDMSPVEGRGEPPTYPEHNSRYGAVSGEMGRDETPYLQQRLDNGYHDNRSGHHDNRSGHHDTQSLTSLDLSWGYYYNEFLREEVIAILAVVFMAFFNQTAMEAMITPLTKTLMNWGELENSILYCVAGVEIMLVFIFIQVLSKRFEDRTLLLFGYVVVLVTIAGLLWYLPRAPPNRPSYNLPFMVVGVALDVFGLPFLVVTSTSLYSKVTQEKTQGLSQGVRSVCGGIGTLLGPLWADSLLHHLYLMLGVMLALMLIALVMLLLSFKHMKQRPDNPHNTSHSVNTEARDNSPLSSSDEERRPLLNQA